MTTEPKDSCVVVTIAVCWRVGCSEQCGPTELFLISRPLCIATAAPTLAMHPAHGDEDKQTENSRRLSGVATRPDTASSGRETRFASQREASP